MKELLKKIYIVFYKWLFNIYYTFVNFSKKHDNMKAVFVLSREEKLQGNLQFVYSELIKQLPNIKIHFVFAENKMNLNLFKELNKISNARYLILDDYYLPIYLIKKPSKSLKVIQLWHAAGAFKKFGHSTIGTKFGPKKSYLKLIPIHSNYTNVYVSSENVVPFYAEAFNMSAANIFALGIPRIDLFTNSNIKKKVQMDISKRHSELMSNGYVNILIAPTYRAVGNQKESTFDLIKVIAEIVPFLNANIKIYFKPHPYTTLNDLDTLKKCPNVVIADDYTLNEWMLLMDGFITDYSSAIFDFSLLKKPFAHFVPDIDCYERSRGFYQDIRKISDGSLIRERDELIKWVNNRTKREYFDTTGMIDYNFDHTKDVTKGIVKHFIN